MLSEGLLTESKAKHLALAKNNRITGGTRFFAPLRSAQNDKSCYVIVNKPVLEQREGIFIAIFATELDSLSKEAIGDS